VIVWLKKEEIVRFAGNIQLKEKFVKIVRKNNLIVQQLKVHCLSKE